MVKASVSELAEQIRGVTYGKDEASATRRPGYLPVLRAGNIRGEGLSFDDLVFVPAARISDRQRIRRNDVLIATSSGSIDVVGKAARALDDYDGGFGAFCKVLRPGAGIDPAYFSHFFRTQAYRRKVSALAAGANINNLRNEDIDDLEIPLPSLANQRRIADILDRADALRAKRRAALARLDSLKAAVFLEMFGDPIRNERQWPVKPFADVCVTKLGKMLDAKRQSGDGRRPYLRNANVQWFEFELDDVFEMDFDERERAILRLAEGDLLICEGGEPGRAAVWNGALEECYFQKALHRARPRAGVANAHYLSWLLWFLAHRQRLTGVTSATIAHLTAEKLAAVPTLLPPLSLQREFAEKLDLIANAAQVQTQSSATLNELFVALQHRAFRGELTV